MYKGFNFFFFQNESGQKPVKEEVMENEEQQKTKVQPKPIKLYPDLPSKPSYKNVSHRTNNYHSFVMSISFNNFYKGFFCNISS